MKIILAPDSFKESLSAADAAAALGEGLSSVIPSAELVAIPLADGGEGTLQTLCDASDFERHSIDVTGAYGKPQRAQFGYQSHSGKAVIELAEAIGLANIPIAARDALAASSFGLGELISASLALNPSQLMIGIGGSATVDGGAGMLQALGVRFYAANGELLTAPLSGAAIGEVARIDHAGLNPRLLAIPIELACDVDNPLLGDAGAAHTFGPQKGADDVAVALLERNLSHLYQLIESALGVSVIQQPGAGAAGGIGAAFLAFTHAQLRRGIDCIIDAVDLRRHLDGADLLITGEGSLDRQTLHGKAPLGVARLAREFGVPVIAVGGRLCDHAESFLGGEFDAFIAATTAPGSTAEAVANAASNLHRSGVRIGQWLRLGQRLNR